MTDYDYICSMSYSDRFGLLFDGELLRLKLCLWAALKSNLVGYLALFLIPLW